jgi:hypothetical protein
MAAKMEASGKGMLICWQIWVVRSAKSNTKKRFWNKSWCATWQIGKPKKLFNFNQFLSRQNPHLNKYKDPITIQLSECIFVGRKRRNANQRSWGFSYSLVSPFEVFWMVLNHLFFRLVPPEELLNFQR